MLFEEIFIYFPERYPAGLWDVQKVPQGQSQDAVSIEECWFLTQDGLNLHGWYCRPGLVKDRLNSALEPPMVLLFFHGNAGNVTYRYEMIRMLMGIPLHVFVMDYRGYGKSQGKPSEEGLYLDGQAAWEYLTRQRRTPPQRVVLFGKSLGGAVAIDLATRVRAAGLIVQSSFTSIPDMARTILPFFPPFLLRTRMDSLSKISTVGCPKLFIHSPADEIVPYRLGRRLFQAAREPKEFYEVPDAPHNETYLVGGEPYLEALRRFMDSLPRSRANAAGQ